MEKDIERLQNLLKDNSTYCVLTQLYNVFIDKGIVLRNQLYDTKSYVPDKIREKYTYDVLKKLVVDDRRSFKSIAEQEGCSVSYISELAKQYEIKSAYTPRNVMIMKKRR